MRRGEERRERKSNNVRLLGCITFLGSKIYFIGRMIPSSHQKRLRSEGERMLSNPEFQKKTTCSRFLKVGIPTSL